MINKIINKPPLGWNSFDCYGCAASEAVLLKNIELMAQKLKPYGYEYFVLDNGWFAEYEIDEGKKFPSVKHANEVRIDQYGRYLPSSCYFPNGLEVIIEKVHNLGLKFGIHLMRGISRKAVEQNTPIMGSEYKAADIANVEDTCNWCHYNYGVNMSSPGAQEFYNSVIALLSKWRVDFIKVDDITAFPDEILGIVNAIDNCERKIILSLSPGGSTSPENMDAYRKGNMLRVTQDIWDDQISIDRSFDAWYKYSKLIEREERPAWFWIDLDMIPFGHLCVWNPLAARKSEILNSNNEELGGKGYERMDFFTIDQKYTFITQRAMAASPLFMGGELEGTDAVIYELLTNKEMLECNQNGVMGHRIYKKDDIEIWKTPSAKSLSEGWIGIFNRNEIKQKIILSPVLVDIINSEHYCYRDIWGQQDLNSIFHSEIVINGNGVLFLRYYKK